VHAHLVAPFDNVLYIEYHSTVLNNVVESPLELQDGEFVPPKEPGLGIVFDGLEQYDKGGEWCRHWSHLSEYSREGATNEDVENRRACYRSWINAGGVEFLQQLQP